MKHLTDLFNDKQYVTELLNEHCIPEALGERYAPINPEWIDLEASKLVTEKFRQLVPDGFPYPGYVIVEKNPDTILDGIGVDDHDKRTRYCIVVVISDTEPAINENLPLIMKNWIFSIFGWEETCAVLVAGRRDIQISVSKESTSTILNAAFPIWVSLYLGRKPYAGKCKLSEQTRGEDQSVDLDVNLYKVREMEQNPVLQRLIEAFDKDYPAEIAGRS